MKKNNSTLKNSQSFLLISTFLLSCSTASFLFSSEVKAMEEEKPRHIHIGTVPFNKEAMFFDTERGQYYFNESSLQAGGSNTPRESFPPEDIIYDDKIIGKFIRLTVLGTKEHFCDGNRPVNIDNLRKFAPEVVLSVEKLTINDIVGNPKYRNIRNKLINCPIFDCKDERTEVETPGEHPFNAHGSMLMTDANGTSIGSGTLIGKRVVLTAGHNLYDRASGKFATSIDFFLRRKGKTDSEKVHGTAMILHPDYLDKTKDQHKTDFGLVILPKQFKEDHFSKPANPAFTILPYKYVYTADVLTKEVNVTGYPGVRIVEQQLKLLGGKIMLTAKGKVKSIEDGRISYALDTTSGQSGSAVWFAETDETGNTTGVVCGVHTNGGDTGGNDKKDCNSGVYLNQENKTRIDRWIEYALSHDISLSLDIKGLTYYLSPKTNIKEDVESGVFFGTKDHLKQNQTIDSKKLRLIQYDDGTCSIQSHWKNTGYLALKEQIGKDGWRWPVFRTQEYLDSYKEKYSRKFTLIKNGDDTCSIQCNWGEICYLAFDTQNLKTQYWGLAYSSEVTDFLDTERFATQKYLDNNTSYSKIFKIIQ